MVGALFAVAAGAGGFWVGKTLLPEKVPSVINRPLQDLYALMTAYDPESGQAPFKLYINPLIGWVWSGLLILVAGTLIAAWPDRSAASTSARHRGLSPTTACPGACAAARRRAARRRAEASAARATTSRSSSMPKGLVR